MPSDAGQGNGKPVLSLLSRGYCHLCDVMREAVLAHPGAAAIELEIVDVDVHDDLVKRFDEQVPVLLAGDQVICWGRFDSRAMDAFLKGQPLLQPKGLRP